MRLPVADLLARVASEEPAPGAGSVAAVVVSLAASLAAMAARRSCGDWDAARAMVAQAELFTERAGALAEPAAHAYSEAVELLAAARDGSANAGEGRLGAALETAAAFPLRTAEAGADVAELGLEIAKNAAPDAREEAIAAAVLAAAAATAAARLVEINLGATVGDPRRVLACELAKKADEAAGQALSLPV